MSRQPPPRYAPYGQWAVQAAKVRLMVLDEKWGVSDAVRQVVSRKRYPDPDKAFKGIRAAYYALRSREKAQKKTRRTRRREEFEI